MSQNVNRLWHSCNWWTYFHWKCSDHNFGAEGSKWGIRLFFFSMPIAATETCFLSC